MTIANARVRCCVMEAGSGVRLNLAMPPAILLPLSACAPSPGRACDGLVYTKDGIDTRQYVPYASHILDTVSVLDRPLEKYGARKDASRFDAMQTMGERRGLLDRLGGTQK